MGANITCVVTRSITMMKPHPKRHGQLSPEEPQNIVLPSLVLNATPVDCQSRCLLGNVLKVNGAIIGSE